VEKSACTQPRTAGPWRIGPGESGINLSATYMARGPGAGRALRVEETGP